MMLSDRFKLLLHESKNMLIK